LYARNLSQAAEQRQRDVAPARFDLTFSATPVDADTKTLQVLQLFSPRLNKHGIRTNVRNPRGNTRQIGFEDARQTQEWQVEVEVRKITASGDETIDSGAARQQLRQRLLTLDDYRSAKR